MEPLVDVLVVEDIGDAVEVEREVGGDEVADLCEEHEEESVEEMLRRDGKRGGKGDLGRRTSVFSFDPWKSGRKGYMYRLTSTPECPCVDQASWARLEVMSANLSKTPASTEIIQVSFLHRTQRDLESPN